MADIAKLVTDLGGMAHKRSLVLRGATDRDLTRAVRRGTVIRARQGWYTTLPEDDLRVRAVRVGGRVTGISAIEAAGGWVLGEHPLHVSVPTNASRLRQQWHRLRRLALPGAPGVVLHWDEATLGDRGDVMSVALRDALHRLVLDEDLETAIAALDWALRTGAMDSIDLHGVIQRLPSRFRNLAEWVDPACDSLPESLSRTRLRLCGHTVRSQVLVGDYERIDLLIDEAIAVEVDGDEYHRDRFEKDRRKDLRITLAGFHALRISARMVFHHWDEVSRGIEAAIARDTAPASKIQENRAGSTRFLPRTGLVRAGPVRNS